MIAPQVLGARLERAPLYREGILSPVPPPNRQRQRGILNPFGCMKAQGHLKRCYHKCYHGMVS